MPRQKLHLPAVADVGQPVEGDVTTLEIRRVYGPDGSFLEWQWRATFKLRDSNGVEKEILGSKGFRVSGASPIWPTSADVVAAAGDHLRSKLGMADGDPV